MRAPTRTETKKTDSATQAPSSCLDILRTAAAVDWIRVPRFDRISPDRECDAVIREAASGSAREVLPGLSSFVKPSPAGSSSVKDSG